MDVSKIPIGKRPPVDFNAVIETPAWGEPVRYRLDRDSGALFVDRFLHAAMRYPANYGFIPQTLGSHGDALHVLVVTDTGVVPGSVIRCRPIGALVIDYEDTVEEQIIAMPVAATDPSCGDMHSLRDLPEVLVKQITHFFEHYADLDGGRSVRHLQWVEANAAEDLLIRAIANYEGNAATAALQET